MKNILLLYRGYPRISQVYQIDEAKILEKKYNIMIFSWDWKLEDVDNTAPSYIFNNPMNSLNQIKNFKPDIIHTQFLDTIDIAHNLSKILDIKFTIRTHSYDMINNESYFKKYKPYLLSDHCLKIIVFPGYFYGKLKELNVPENKIHINYPQINIKPFINLKDVMNGDDIMGCGAFIKKKILRNLL